MSNSANSEVAPSVIEAITIFMVNKQALRGVGNHTVHKNLLSVGSPAGVKSVTLFADTPFIAVQPIIVLGIDDGKFSLSQRYEPDVIAVGGRGLMYG